jgi:hypothetical protein
MLNSDTQYKNMKRQINRHNANNYLEKDSEELSNVSHNMFLKNKTNREAREYNEEVTRVIPNSMLEEIKKESIKQNIKKISTRMNPEWTEHFDPQTRLNYYYNHLTGLSQWEKPNETSKFSNIPSDIPSDIQSNEIKYDKKSQEENTKRTNESKEGLIGKWEVVDKSDSFFEKNKVNAINSSKDFMPGIISEDKYHKLEQGLSDSGEEQDEIENEIENEENLNKDDFIKLNKKLRNIDYHISYVNEKSTDYNEESIIKQSQSKDKNSDYGPVSFTFNTKKKNDKKVSSIFSEI